MKKKRQGFPGKALHENGKTGSGNAGALRTPPEPGQRTPPFLRT